MKTGYRITKLAIVAAAVGLAAVWMLLFSDYAHGSGFTLSDKVNAAFFSVFIVTSVFSTLGFLRIQRVQADFARANWYLQEHPEDTALNLDTNCFKDERTINLYKTYRENANELRRENPDGWHGTIGDYFFEENFDEYLRLEVYDQYPGFFTGVGMLGTFVGLSMGLLNLNDLGGSAEQLMIQLSPLMSCIQLAFITSISGLFLSFFFNFQYRRGLKELYENLDLFVHKYSAREETVDTTGLSRMLEQQVKQSTLLSNLSENIAIKVSDVLLEQMKKMETAYNAACDRLAAAQIEGMDHMVNMFTKELMGTLTQGVGVLSESVKATNEYQERITNTMKEDIARILDMSQDVQEIQQLSAQTVEDMKEYTNHMEKIIKSMQDQVATNNQIMREATYSLNSFKEQAEIMADASNNLSEGLDDWLDKSADRIDDYGRKLDSVTKQMETLSGKLQKTMELSFTECNEERERFSTDAEDLLTTIRAEKENVTTAVGHEIGLLRGTVENCRQEIVDAGSDATQKMDAWMKTMGDKCGFVAASVDDAAERVTAVVNSIPERMSSVDTALGNMEKGIMGKIDSAMQNQTASVQAVVDDMKYYVKQELDKNGTTSAHGEVNE